MRADRETVLYRESDLEVIAVVEEGLYYGIPKNVKAWEGSVEQFLINNPDYSYDDPDHIYDEG